MKKKDHIVFVNQSSGYLMIDIANAFADQYDKRTLIAGFLNPRNKQLDKEVNVRKIMRYDRSTTIKRLLSWSIGFIQILILIVFKYRNAHLFLVSNPPFSTLVPLFCRNNYTLLIYDVYPDALIEHKVIKGSSWVIKQWKLWNKKVYKKAEKVYTISRGMKKVLSQYVDEDKIKSVPIWTDNTFLKPIPKVDNPFLRRHNLHDKFVVLYSGNLGYTHDVEVMIELAQQTREDDIVYLIIGEGDKRSMLSDSIKSSKLHNCILLPWQATDQLPYTLSAADVAVVTLSKNASKLSVPSKTYNYMSVGAPILAIAEKDAELAELISRYKTGECHSADDIEASLSFIQRVKNDTTFAKTIKENVLRASQEFSPKNVQYFCN